MSYSTDLMICSYIFLANRQMPLPLQLFLSDLNFSLIIFHYNPNSCIFSNCFINVQDLVCKCTKFLLIRIIKTDNIISINQPNTKLQNIKFAKFLICFLQVTTLLIFNIVSKFGTAWSHYN